MGLSKKQIIGAVALLVLIAGVGAGVYLVQTQQILKSKASGNFMEAFEIKDANGNIIQCDGSTNPPTCDTGTLDIQVRVRDANALLP